MNLLDYEARIRIIRRMLLPIYMYHQIADNGTDAYLDVSPAALDAQLVQLRKAGFSFVTLAQAWQQENRPSKSVVLTFDDVGELFYKNALPILKKHGAQATAFVIGNDFSSEASENLPKGYAPLSKEQLGELIDYGIEIGSHTMSHRELTGLPDDELETELVSSKRVLEEICGTEIKTLCYPRGRVSQRVVAATKKAGYVCACSTLRGNVQSEPFMLKRVRATEKRLGFSLRYTTMRVYDWFNRSRYQRDIQTFENADTNK